MRLTGGNSARPVFLDSSQCPFVFEDRNAPFLQIQGDSPSHKVIKIYVRRQGSEKCQRDHLASAVFSNTLSFIYLICQGAIFWGSLT